MEKLFFLISIITFSLSCTPLQQSETDSAIADQDKRVEWWRDARFGLFIHWGIYAQPAGEWKGEKIPRPSEWIMARAQIPVKEYEKLAETFNPVHYNAEQWVKLAKQAGMKYIVITSKHHDGFAMFHSKVSQYNIIDATPFDRDPLKELADACKKHGMRLGFYYSQAQDWHEPGGTYYNIEEGEPHWDPDLEREPLMNYIKEKAVPQVKEILENYGKVDILWWDTPFGMTEEAAQMLQNVVDQYPQMLTNNRLYQHCPGDFITPEQHLPPTNLGYEWEVCMTMNTSWGYKHYDDHWKSSERLIRMLVDVTSKGGNLLLNVGPTAEGLIPEPSVERLMEIGEWMAINKESIYGTDSSPFFKLHWGRCTKRKTKSGTNLYLHVFNWPEDQVLRVPGLKTKVKNVSLLSDKKQVLSSHFEDNDLLINLPNAMPDPINTVIIVETKGNLEVTCNMPSFKEGKIFLPANFANIHNIPGSVYDIQALLEGSGESSIIANWIDHRTWLEWMFITPEPGIYNVEVLVKADEPARLTICIGEKAVVTEIPATKGEFTEISLGEIEISETGDITLRIHPVQDNWKGVELAKVKLVKTAGVS